MKHFFAIIAAALLAATSVFAQTPVKYVFTEASDLTLIGKILENTPNPYHRVDTCRYKGFTPGKTLKSDALPDWPCSLLPILRLYPYRPITDIRVLPPTLWGWPCGDMTCI